MGDCIIIVQNITQNDVHGSRVNLKFRGSVGISIIHVVPVFGGASCMMCTVQGSISNFGDRWEFLS